MKLASTGLAAERGRWHGNKLDAEWLRTRDGEEVWLAVYTLNRDGAHKGRSSDGADALGFVGPGSWVYGATAYLCETDAFRWLDSIGSDGETIPGRVVLRPPNGYRSVRDEAAAAIMEGNDGAAYYAALEAAHYPPDDYVEPNPAAALTKAQRKAANRALAAEVRALGVVPNGAAWERAKQLAAAGEVLTLEALQLT